MPKNKSNRRDRNKKKKTYTKRGGCKCNKSFFGGKDKTKTIKIKRKRKMKGGNNPIDVLLGRDEFFNNPITSGISFKGSVIAKDVINAN